MAKADRLAVGVPLVYRELSHGRGGRPRGAGRKQAERTRKLKAGRSQGTVDDLLRSIEDTAKGTGNLLPPMKDALRARATLGEVSDVLRGVFGEYHPSV